MLNWSIELEILPTFFCSWLCWHIISDNYKVETSSKVSTVSSYYPEITLDRYLMVAITMYVIKQGVLGSYLSSNLIMWKLLLSMLYWSCIMFPGLCSLWSLQEKDYCFECMPARNPTALYRKWARNTYELTCPIWQHQHGMKWNFILLVNSCNFRLSVKSKSFDNCFKINNLLTHS